jgi:hypothetical protein
MQTSVYWIRHKDHADMFSQGYIGVSKYAEKRFSQHYKRTQNRHLKFAIEKYGWDNLVKQRILIADEAYCLEIEQKLRPEADIGWNCAIGGGIPPSAVGNKYAQGGTWNRGRKASLETRKKISENSKAQWQRMGMREILSNAKKGKPSARLGAKHTPESIEKMRLAHTGKPSKKKGVLWTVEEKLKYIEAVRSKPWTCPHCNKIGYNLGAGNRWHFNNCKNKGA